MMQHLKRFRKIKICKKTDVAVKVRYIINTAFIFFSWGPYFYYECLMRKKGKKGAKALITYAMKCWPDTVEKQESTSD